MNETISYMLTVICIFILTLVVFLSIHNYEEHRQCEILSSGINTNIEPFFIFYDKCYVKLDSGVVVNADNFRGISE